MSYDLNYKKEKIKKFIREHPKTTYKEIKEDLGIKLERVYSNMESAFKDAKVLPPRNFKRKTREEKIKIILDYIKKYPKSTTQDIRKITKINSSKFFKNINEAFETAGINYPRNIDNRSKKEKIKAIIKCIKKDPILNITDLSKKTRTKPYTYFKTFKEIYKSAGINYISKQEKRKTKKKQEIINFIKKNPFCTQREINAFCKTHVQDIFNNGIFEAYSQAKIKFPYERLKLYGIVLKSVRDRAKTFEDKIAFKLGGYGKVNRLVKTKRGVADIVFERNHKKAIIEIKDYKSKEISMSQINQLNRYLEDSSCNLGFLICNQKPKKDKVLIGDNTIIILEKGELSQIPNILDGDVVQR
ncbi:MAG: hypothetical protein PHD81_00130 [Candidatus Nanoarchaeia archaeon]|nr:hypothetical protein [Candidatus Nanoarchaeia archaeon]MDD5587499.1 hypothetical protein [Candidatus Nanoarchaeia archaeon]